MLYEGKWVGTVRNYNVCITGGCITLPRQIETIEAAALCGRPITVRNEWYEYLESGPGITSETSGFARQLIPKGDFCAFDDVVGPLKKLAVYCDVAEEADARIILQFYNSAAQWVRTIVGPEWIDGESLVLPAAGAYAYTTNICMPGGFMRCIKPVTNGAIRIYEYNTLTSALKPLAYYEPDETVPTYRRYVIPCVNPSSNGGSGCQSRSLTIAGKIRFIPVARDNDFLCISHKDAIVLACQAVRKMDADLPGEASLYMYGGIEPVSKQRIVGAIPLLGKQLEHYRGHGAVQPVRFVTQGIWGPGIPQLQ